MFCYEFYDHIRLLGNAPPGQNAEFTETINAVAVQSINKNDVNKNYLNILSSGKDPWGSEILFFENAPGIWTIQSFGPNQKDEKGNGDDVLVSVDLSREIDEIVTN